MAKKTESSRPPTLKKSTLPTSRQDVSSPIVTQRRFAPSRGVIRLILQGFLFFLVFWIGHELVNRITGTNQTMQHATGQVATKSSSTTSKSSKNSLFAPGKPQVKGCFVMLTRNGDLHSVRATVRQIEDRLNKRYNYPYIFINDQPFTEKFKDFTSAMTDAPTHYGEIPPEQWGWPDWVDQQTAMKNMQQMEEQKVLYGGSLSYRHMCRFESGFFFRHPLLDQCDYYWRIEPGVYYYCDMEDPFALMAKQKGKYGFTISLLEYKETIPSLWQTVKDFMKEWNANHPNDKLPRDQRMYSFVTDDEGESYNLCHFWSNFEVGSVAWFRSKEYISFFDYLDKTGNFYYERWGDAPVHSIAVAIFLKFEEVIFYNDIGYKHEPFTHCPSDLSKYHKSGKCFCDPGSSFDLHWYSCLSRWIKISGDVAQERPGIVGGKEAMPVERVIDQADGNGEEE